MSLFSAIIYFFTCCFEKAKELELETQITPPPTPPIRRNENSTNLMLYKRPKISKPRRHDSMIVNISLNND